MIVAFALAIIALLTILAALAIGWVARLLVLLFAERKDDPVIVFGVLEVVLSQDVIAGRLRIARQLQVFLGNMRRCTPDLDVGSVGLKAPRQRILAFAVVIIIVVVVVLIVIATASTAMLLSLPHGLPISLLTFVMCTQTASTTEKVRANLVVPVCVLPWRSLAGPTACCRGV